MTISRMTPVAELMQSQAFGNAKDAMQRVRNAMTGGFSAEATRKEGSDYLNRAYKDVKGVINDVIFAYIDRADQDQYAVYWDTSFPFDLHHVRDKHYAYAASFRDDLEPLFAVVRELVALRGELKAYVLHPKKTAKKDRAPVEGEAFKTVGICPCCGLEYAVHAKTGGMSKHGYKVDKNWSIFTGVCDGEARASIEVERAFADSQVLAHKERAAELAVQAQAMAQGKVSPQFVNRGTLRKAELVPFADLPEREQRQEREIAVRDMEYKAREHARFAEFLSGQIAKYHGQPLRRVPV